MDKIKTSPAATDDIKRQVLIKSISQPNETVKGKPKKTEIELTYHFGGETFRYKTKVDFNEFFGLNEEPSCGGCKMKTDTIRTFLESHRNDEQWLAEIFDEELKEHFESWAREAYAAQLEEDELKQRREEQRRRWGCSSDEQ